MNKGKLIFGAGVVTLMIITASAPGAFSSSFSVMKEKSESASIQTLVYVGDLYIEGTGEHETSIVMATAEHDLRINVDPMGSDVIIEAKYLLQCPGLFDYGYAELWVSGAPEKSVDTDHFAEGYLYTTVYNCKWGDIIDWVLTVIYDDLLFPYPLIDFDGGGGICNKAYNSRETSNHIFLQFLEKFTDQFPYSFPILRHLASRLQSNIITLKGKIICE